MRPSSFTRLKLGENETVEFIRLWSAAKRLRPLQPAHPLLTFPNALAQLVLPYRELSEKRRCRPARRFAEASPHRRAPLPECFALVPNGGKCIQRFSR